MCTQLCVHTREGSVATQDYLCSVVLMCHTGPIAQSKCGNQQPSLHPMLTCDLGWFSHAHVKFPFPVREGIVDWCLEGSFPGIAASRNACEVHDPQFRSKNPKQSRGHGGHIPFGTVKIVLFLR